MTSSSNSTSPSDERAGWLARLELAIDHSRGKSTVVERRHEGPLVVQRPFHPEADGTCHVLVLHPPGGLVSSDRLALSCEVRAGARAVLTTPAATKLYRARTHGAPASQHVTLSVGEQAFLEYLPQESIAFDGARAELVTEVALAREASFLGWEICCLGRPAANERFTRGSLVQRWHVRREGRPLYIERLALAGDGTPLSAAYGMRGEPVTGTFLAVPKHDHASHLPRAERLVAVADAVREALDAMPVRGLYSVSARDELILTRYLGPSTEQARNVFERAWSVLRTALFEKTESAPRIWKT